MDLLKDYNPDLSDEQFKIRYAGVFDVKNRLKISKEQMQKIWDAFELQIDEFLNSHKNLKRDDIERIGVDKFILTLGIQSPEEVNCWKLNKVRIGYCGHCKNQFIPMMFQHNYGVCDNCRPSFSSIAIREFIKKQLNTNRYMNATQDLYMDFFIMFYSDDVFRGLFLKGTDYSNDLEKESYHLPQGFIGGRAKMHHELFEGKNGVYEVKANVKKRTTKKRKRK